MISVGNVIKRQGSRLLILWINISYRTKAAVSDGLFMNYGPVGPRMALTAVKKGQARAKCTAL